MPGLIEYFQKAGALASHGLGAFQEMMERHDKRVLMKQIDAHQDMPKQYRQLLKLSVLEETVGIRDYLATHPKTKPELQEFLMDSLLFNPEIHKQPRALVEVLQETDFNFFNYFHKNLQRTTEHKIWTLPVRVPTNSMLEAAAILVAERTRERMMTLGEYRPDFYSMYANFTAEGHGKYDDIEFTQGVMSDIQRELVLQVRDIGPRQDEGRGAGYLHARNVAGDVDAKQARLWTVESKNWQDLAGKFPSKESTFLRLG